MNAKLLLKGACVEGTVRSFHNVPDRVFFFVSGDVNFGILSIVIDTENDVMLLKPMYDTLAELIVRESKEESFF